MSNQQNNGSRGSSPVERYLNELHATTNRYWGTPGLSPVEMLGAIESEKLMLHMRVLQAASECDGAPIAGIVLTDAGRSERNDASDEGSIVDLIRRAIAEVRGKASPSADDVARAEAAAESAKQTRDRANGLDSWKDIYWQ